MVSYPMKKDDKWSATCLPWLKVIAPDGIVFFITCRMSSGKIDRVT